MGEWLRGHVASLRTFCKGPMRRDGSRSCSELPPPPSSRDLCNHASPVRRTVWPASYNSLAAHPMWCCSFHLLSSWSCFWQCCLNTCVRFCLTSVFGPPFQRFLTGQPVPFILPAKLWYQEEVSHGSLNFCSGRLVSHLVNIFLEGPCAFLSSSQILSFSP